MTDSFDLALPEGLAPTAWRRPIGRPTRGDADTARAMVGEWLRTPRLLELASEFGFPGPSDDTGQLLGALDDWSSTAWDFRAGRDRWHGETPPLPVELLNTILEAAVTLGMVYEYPPLGPCVRRCPGTRWGRHVSVASESVGTRRDQTCERRNCGRTRLRKAGW